MKQTSIIIEEGGLDRADVIEILTNHLKLMHSITPLESAHALDLTGLRQPDIKFWTLRHDGQAACTGALKTLNTHEAEIKSMHTVPEKRRAGLAETMLSHILAWANQSGLKQLYLETGSQPEFAPARKLYERHGFSYCPPFADYKPDPLSVFMTKTLS